MERLPVEPTITDVMKASKFLRNRVRRTPAEYSFALSERAGAPVVLKLDNQQICGSFKVRGAFYKMFSLSRETLERGVVTCSSGNHAQGVAKAAAELRAKSWIYVPDVCPETKKTAIRRLGGEWVELVVANGDYDFAEGEARAFAAERGMTFISPFEDSDVIAGQGTAGVEFLADEPDIELLLVPAGGGALHAWETLLGSFWMDNGSDPVFAVPVDDDVARRFLDSMMDVNANGMTADSIPRLTEYVSADEVSSTADLVVLHGEAPDEALWMEIYGCTVGGETVSVSTADAIVGGDEFAAALLAALEKLSADETAQTVLRLYDGDGVRYGGADTQAVEFAQYLLGNTEGVYQLTSE